MPIILRAAASAVLLGNLFAGDAAAQGSPYIPLDDPRLPLLEHLITRGDIDDPSPLIRPFRRADAVRILAQADTAPGTRSGVLIAELRQRFADPSNELWYAIEPRIGGQVYTDARRDLLHPEGPGDIQPYGELGGQLVFANVVLATRPAGEPRIIDDPDWRGRRDLKFAGRLVEGYVSAQFRFAKLLYGQLDHNWGPVGVPGIPLSDVGYERQSLIFSVGSRDVGLTALATDLRDQQDTAGRVVHRYYFVHRLGARLSRRLHLAAWEGILISGADRNFETRYRNPLSFSYLVNTIGLGDRGNVILGLDVHWRAFGRTTLEAQLAVDDIQYKRRSGPLRYPNRYAFTIAAFGPIGSRLGWRGLYTQASSLAFRASNPFESFTDDGVGIGRNFADNDQTTLFLTVPLRQKWLLRPELTLLRQGEGRITDPFPASAEEAGALPTLFIGTTERTYRAALDISGAAGPIELQASGGIHRIANAGHLPGVNDTRFVGRIQATLGFRRSGTFH